MAVVLAQPRGVTLADASPDRQGSCGVIAFVSETVSFPQAGQKATPLTVGYSFPDLAMAFTKTPLVLTSVSPAMSRGAPQWMMAACAVLAQIASAERHNAERIARNAREVWEGWFFKGTVVFFLQMVDRISRLADAEAAEKFASRAGKDVIEKVGDSFVSPVPIRSNAPIAIAILTRKIDPMARR